MATLMRAFDQCLLFDSLPQGTTRALARVMRGSTLVYGGPCWCVGAQEVSPPHHRQGRNTRPHFGST